MLIAVEVTLSDMVQAVSPSKHYQKTHNLRYWTINEWLSTTRHISLNMFEFILRHQETGRCTKLRTF